MLRISLLRATTGLQMWLHTARKLKATLCNIFTNHFDGSVSSNRASGVCHSHSATLLLVSALCCLGFVFTTGVMYSKTVRGHQITQNANFNIMLLLARLPLSPKLHVPFYLIVQYIIFQPHLLKIWLIDLEFPLEIQWNLWFDLFFSFIPFLLILSF